MKRNYRLFVLLFCFLSYSVSVISQSNELIRHNAAKKTIVVSDEAQNLTLTLDYSRGCKIIALNIKGENTLSPAGVYTAIETVNSITGSPDQNGTMKITKLKDGIRVENISFGEGNVTETWTFQPVKNMIRWTIQRNYSKDVQLEDMAFPVWNFANLSVWKGGLFDNGGMVWCKYFKQNDTYGVHTAGITFWNPDSGNAFRIAPAAGRNKYLASKYSQTESGEFRCTQYVTDTELEQRYQQNRFVRGKQNVFAPFTIKKGEVTLQLDLQYVDYEKEYSRGVLPGIDAVAVRELLNTTGRYGVVDNNIIGANGWVSNWKCLHEPFFAQIGMAVDDKNYVDNFSSTLNRERDLAMREDGRVLSRWHGVAGDEMPGTYDYKTGYYEAKWGYTVDSQTGYVINVAEQFDLNGDIRWLKSHKISCEKALDWLIRRDSNNNGIFEMANNNIREEKSSDWVDVVWASFENAFVNAQMYEALKLWSNCENVLNDTEKSLYYLNVAQRLKEAFNKPVEEGGFWYPEKKQYVYWRDDDGSIHGDNLVTPVNFAAIAFGICDDPQRIAAILEQIEARMQAENLFHWPLCFDSYRREEVSGGNWPFPKYENGDIFPTWGYLGIRAYIHYDKAIALKYIQNILNQYNKDGLSSQRYSRVEQEGVGGDILAGISSTITALYRDIYGIRPKWNRMGIEPNMLTQLNGAEFDYTLRNTTYHLKLSVNDYEISTGNITVRSKNAFGMDVNGDQITIYPGNREEHKYTITAKTKEAVVVEIDADIILGAV